jgi:hypothetical protein
MVSLAGRVLSSASWPAALACLLLCVGCRSPRDSDLFQTTGPGWQVREGQALWRPRRAMPELGGDLVVASNADGRCVAQFIKTPMVLVLAQTSRTNWLVEFPPRRMGFMGRGSPPKYFAWLYLNAALTGQALPPAFRFEQKPNGAWRLENTKSGESMEGFLGP